jgi:hypothetical protein
MPVKTMAMPRRSAAAITSGSRTEPPGWITAVAPAFAASSTPSANGKNASEATTLPASGCWAFITPATTLPLAGLYARISPKRTLAT